MRGAVLDLGSHSFHALAAVVDAIGIRRELFDRKIVTRVGERFDTIEPATYDNALVAVRKLVKRVRRHAPVVRVVATGVFRSAANGRRFIEEAIAKTGIDIELLDGNDEARLTWTGVSAELAGSHGRLAVIDLGGGSLELAAGTATAERVHTLPLGVLRLRQLSATDVQRTIDAIAAPAIADIRAERADTIALASGTARALLAVARRLGLVGTIQRHASTRTFRELACRLAGLGPRALADLGVHEPRQDTIIPGAVAIAAVLEGLGRPVVYVARGALREGVLIDHARRLVAIRVAG